VQSVKQDTAWLETLLLTSRRGFRLLFSPSPHCPGGH